MIFLNNHPSLKAEDLHSVRRLVCGAAPLAATDTQKFLSKFSKSSGPDSLKVIQGFGLTEASPLTHVQKSNGADGMEGVGFALPSTMCRIVGLDDNLDKDVGESGELWIKGPQVLVFPHSPLPPLT